MLLPSVPSFHFPQDDDYSVSYTLLYLFPSSSGGNVMLSTSST